MPTRRPGTGWDMPQSRALQRTKSLVWRRVCVLSTFFFFFQAEDGIRDLIVTGVQTCALPISHLRLDRERPRRHAAAPRAPRGRIVHQRPGRRPARRAGVHRMTAGRVAVIGAGTMGHGIAYAAALAGFDVRLTDSKPDALRFAMGRLNDLLAIAVRRGKLTEQDRDAAAGRLRAESDFAPAVLEAEVGIEAAGEP